MSNITKLVWHEDKIYLVANCEHLGKITISPFHDGRWYGSHNKIQITGLCKTKDGAVKAVDKWRKEKLNSRSCS